MDLREIIVFLLAFSFIRHFNPFIICLSYSHFNKIDTLFTLEIKNNFDKFTASVVTNFAVFKLLFLSLLAL